MKILCTVLLVMICAGNVLGQKETNQWISFVGSGLDFNSDSCIAVSFPSNMPMWRCDASICDKNGKMMFYTNGAKIYNSHFKLMQNGDKLNLGDFSYDSPIHDGAVIIPYPGDSNKYYLIHTDLEPIIVNGFGDLTSMHLYYDVIDMSLDQGKGGVILDQKEILFFTDTLADAGIQAVKHGNGRDWWILVHEYGSNNYLRFLVDNNGIHGPNLQSIGMIYTGSNATGYFCNGKFNQQGTQYIKNNNDSTLFELYDFDRCSGLLSNRRQVLVSDSIYYLMGLSFSPSGRYAYISANDWTYLFQFDLLADSIEASKVLIDVYNGASNPDPTDFYDHQLGPDGKIYICNYDGNASLHVINNPDSAGKKCNFVQNQVTLYPNTYWGSGMPNLPNYQLGPLNGSGCDTVVTNVLSHKEVYTHGVYPNPCIGRFQLNITGVTSKADIVLYNTMGEVIEQTTLEPAKGFVHGFFNVQNQPSGIYLLKAHTDRGDFSEKILKE